MEKKVHVVLRLDEFGDVDVIGVFKDKNRADQMVEGEISCGENAWRQSEYLYI